MSSYIHRLRDSFKQTGSLVCMGLDPVMEFLPFVSTSVREDLNRFYSTIFRKMNLEGVFPGAFKTEHRVFSHVSTGLGKRISRGPSH